MNPVLSVLSIRRIRRMDRIIDQSGMPEVTLVRINRRVLTQLGARLRGDQKNVPSEFQTSVRQMRRHGRRVLVRANPGSRIIQ